MRPYSMLLSVSLAFVIATVVLSISVHADEGMWVFNNLPLAQLKARYGFDLPRLGRASPVRGGPVQ